MSAGQRSAHVKFLLLSLPDLDPDNESFIIQNVAKHEINLGLDIAYSRKRFTN